MANVCKCPIIYMGFIYPRWCRISSIKSMSVIFLNWPGITRRRGVAFFFDHADGQEDVSQRQQGIDV